MGSLSFFRQGPLPRITQEEIFAPVLRVMTFRTPEEAIVLANLSSPRRRADIRSGWQLERAYNAERFVSPQLNDGG